MLNVSAFFCFLRERAKAGLTRFGFRFFIFSGSAKSNYGIDEIFVTLLVEIEKDSGLLDIHTEPNVVSKAKSCSLQ